MQERRVVITGIGGVCCLGKNVETIWSDLIAGKCGIGPITLFDASQNKTRIGGEVPGFDPCCYMPAKEARHMDRFVQLAIAAADEAMTSSGLKELLSGGKADPGRVGSLVSSGTGGLSAATEACRVIAESGPARLSPFLISRMIGNMASGYLAIRYGFSGPVFGVVSACSTGCHSVGEAYHIIKRDDADVMLAGGAEASVQELSIGGFNALRALSTRNDDPQHASRPFDRDRDGFVASEGAGVLILEELEHAKRRGAQILCEVVGCGATCDGYHITSPDPEGKAVADAYRIAMKHAKITPADINYINAHGTSTVLNDKYETIALKRALGDAAYRIPISSTKGAMGHALGAAGALECIFCVQTVRTGIIPPTINYQTPDPECDLDYTPNEARSRCVRIAANDNLGFGGHNAVVLFKKYE